MPKAALRLMMTVGSPEVWTPATLGDKLLVWLDPTDAGAVVESGGVVSQLIDQSGFRRHFEQTSATARPVLTSGSLVFDGINDILESVAPDTPTVSAPTFTSAVTLPDGALGATAGKGWTCTGVTYDETDDTLWVGNHGIAEEGDPVWTPSLINLNLAGTTIIDQIDVLALVPGTTSLQGVTIDTSNDSLWVAALLEDKLINVTKAGVLLDEVAFTDPNGLAYDPGTDTLIVLNLTTATVSVVNKTTGAVIRDWPTGSLGLTDHIWFDASTRYLYITAGTNGAAAHVYVFNHDSAIHVATIETFDENLACEGMCIGPDNTIYMVADMYFHGATFNKLLKYSHTPVAQGLGVGGTKRCERHAVVMVGHARAGAGNNTSGFWRNGGPISGSSGGGGIGLFANYSGGDVLTNVRVFTNGTTGTTTRVITDHTVVAQAGTTEMAIISVLVDATAHTVAISTNGNTATSDTMLNVVDTLIAYKVSGGSEIGGSTEDANRYAELTMREHLVIDDPTTDELQRLEGYLASKHGLVALLPVTHPYRENRNFYVSTSGGTGAGTIGDPWSLTFAGSGAGGLLEPGDTVLVRGGTYSATAGFALSVSGTSGNEITFKNYPGETPILNGAYAAFDSVGNSAWQLYDAGTDTYETVASSGFTAGEVGGHIQISGKWFPLATHGPIECLTASTQEYRATASLPSPDYYLGPGVGEDLQTGRIMIRLTNAEAYIHPGRTIAQVANIDPRQNALKIFSGQQYGFTVTGSYLVIDGFTINDYYSLISLAGTHNTVTNITGRFGQVATRISGSYHTFTYCTFDGLMDPDDWWFAWGDAKNGRTIGDATRKAGFSPGTSTHITIQHCTIRNVFDGMAADSGSYYEVSYNDFINCWDDAWQMYSNLFEINLHHNNFFGAGPSHDNSGSNNVNAAPGTVYIHHNIIDTSQQLIEWGRVGTFDNGGNPEGLGECLPMSAHGQADVDRWSHPWKVYYNTIITGADRITTSGFNLQLFNNIYAGNHHAQPHEVYNNIFIHDGNFGRDVEFDTAREIYDGNVYDPTADTGSYARYSFGHTSTGTLTTYAQLGSTAKIRATQALADSQVYYAPGYEANGLEVDPALDVNYRPVTASCLTGAIDLTAKGWPGATSYQAARGAVP